MPLRADADLIIQEKLKPTKHLVSKGARNRTDPAHKTWAGASCEHWALRGLDNNKVLMSELMSAVLLDFPWPDRLNDNQIRKANQWKENIYEIFGNGLDDDQYLIKGFKQDANNPLTQSKNKKKEKRDKHRGNLHTFTSAFFELCLEVNGFSLARGESDYMVCMEYENALSQPMYPNFTHAWLMYKGTVIQTVPSAYISISRREAGRQDHCGIIRRYVDDFSEPQCSIINDILQNPHCTRRGVTGCRSKEVTKQEYTIEDFVTGEKI